MDDQRASPGRHPPFHLNMHMEESDTKDKCPPTAPTDFSE